MSASKSPSIASIEYTEQAISSKSPEKSFYLVFLFNCCFNQQCNSLEHVVSTNSVTVIMPQGLRRRQKVFHLWLCAQVLAGEKSIKGRQLMLFMTLKMSTHVIEL